MVGVRVGFGIAKKNFKMTGNSGTGNRKPRLQIAINYQYPEYCTFNSVPCSWFTSELSLVKLINIILNFFSRSFAYQISSA